MKAATAPLPGDAGAEESDGSVPFYSILFPDPDDPGVSGGEEPDFFRDLNLDQVVGAITADFREYDLSPFFHVPLSDPDAIAYRQEVMRDLGQDAMLRAIGRFAKHMRDTRARLSGAEKVTYPLAAQRWFLEAAEVYCHAAEVLDEDLDRLHPASRGLRAFHEYLSAYVGSAPFNALATEARRLTAELTQIRYAILIDGNTVTVRPFEDEADYAVAVEDTFRRFRQGASKDYRVAFPSREGVNHVTAQILEGVARSHTATFAALKAFGVEHAAFLDSTLIRFDREIQFYVAYLTHVARFRDTGLSFCSPQVSRTSKAIHGSGSFDLALATKLLAEKTPVVTNDFFLEDGERVLVVSGPNQGGKTTFARMFGQLHYLGRLGCPVPGTVARLFLADHIFTHFERQEDATSLRGKLQDDLVRIHRILEDATANSVVVINEMFASTTVDDAVALSKIVMTKLFALGGLAVWVTFLTELASLDRRAVSLVSTVDPADPTVRTYRVDRRPADGLAYALAIARKYGITYDRLMERMTTCNPA